MKSLFLPRFRFAPALAVALAASALLAQQPITYNNGDTNSTAYSTTAPNDPTTLTIASGNATQSGAITGTGALIKDGAGTLTLGGYSSTLSGATTISAGTLQFSGGLGLPNSAITLNSGAMLRVDNFSTATIGSLSGSGALSFQYGELQAGGNNASTTFSGSLAGSGTLVKTGTGTLTFTGTSTGGQLDVSGGTLLFTPSSASNYAGPISASSGGSLIVSPSDPSKFVSNVAVNSGGSATLALPNSTPLAATDISVYGGSLTLSGFGATALSATTLDLNSGATANLPETVTLGGLGGSGSSTLALSGGIGFGDISVGASNISSSFFGTLSITGVTSTHFYKIGTGTWTLATSLGSDTIVQAGYVALASGGQANSVALQGGGLRYASAMTHTGSLTVQPGGGTIDTGSNNVTLSGTIAGGSLTPGVDQLIKLGSGTLTLTGDNSSASVGFAGTLALNAGVVSVAGTANLGTAASPVYFGGGTLNTTASFTSAHPVTLNSGGGTFDVASGTTLTWNGGLTGASGNSFTKAGAGTLTLGSSGNTLSGATTISAGTLQFSGSADGLPNSAVTLSSGATLAVASSVSATAGSLAGAGAVSFSPSAQLSFGGNNASTTFSGSLSGGGTLEKTGTGTFTFSGTFSGSPQLLTTGGTTIFSPSASATSSGLVDAGSGSTVIVAPPDPSKFTGSLTVRSGGNLTISLPNSTPLGGNIFYNGGTLTLNGFASTALSRATVDLNSGATVNLSDGTVFGRLNAANTTFRFSDPNPYAGLNISVGANDLDSMLDGTFSGLNTTTSSSASVHITKIGTGTLTLGNLNTTVEVQAGYALVSSASSVGLNGGGVRYASDTTHSGLIYVQTNGTIDTVNHDVTFSGTLDSNASTTLAKIGSGSLTLTGTNHFSGALAINGGAVSVSASDKLGFDYPEYGLVSTLAFGGGTLGTTASFTSTHPATLNSGGGTLDVASGTTLTWNSVIAGSSGNALTKTGAGTLTLSGANTYSGGTTISFGTVNTTHATALGTGPVTIGGASALLRLGGTLANSVAVSTGGTLSGTGGVGSLTVGSGGNLSPGNSPGTLTATTATFAGGGNYRWEINDAAGASGTNYDLLSISGALNITATSGNRFTITLTSLLPDNTSGQVINFNSAINQSYTVASASDGIGNFDASAFTLDSTGFTNPTNGGIWSLGVNGNNLDLSFTAGAIPEPATYAALAGACALGLAIGYRRRRAVG